MKFYPYYRLILPVILTVLLAFPACKHKAGSSETAEDTTPLKKGVILVDYREKRKVDVFIDGDVFTSYIYPEDLRKPVLFPVRSANGTELTRGFPIQPREGERVDHLHHTGAWFSFGAVNKIDFWTHSNEGARILHRGVKRAESRESLGVLEIAADWQVPHGDEWHTVLQENTIFEFSGDEHTRTIDRITQLTAQENEVLFEDNKEGLFAIRVRREMEHPSEEPVILTDQSGKPGSEKIVDKKGVNGSYLNSEGLEGTDAWGKPARWLSLRSNVGDEKISITMFDHPSNTGYPAHWHARGYGLFAANNFGVKAFDETKDPVETLLQPGESIVFRHRLHISSGFHTTDKQIEELFEDFASGQ